MTIMIELTRKTIEDIATIIDERMVKRESQCERLYKLKDISDMINIPIRTLRKMNIPYRRLGQNTRKMYSLKEVRDYLKR